MIYLVASSVVEIQEGESFWLLLAHLYIHHKGVHKRVVNSVHQWNEHQLDTRVQFPQSKWLQYSTPMHLFTIWSLLRLVEWQQRAQTCQRFSSKKLNVFMKHYCAFGILGFMHTHQSQQTWGETMKVPVALDQLVNRGLAYLACKTTEHHA